MNDVDYMQRALFLAEKGAGYVAPNPLVGAVLVHENKIIGEGWHEQFGKAHAEVNCINSVALAHQSKISKSTLYVTLEPCAHFGKTPPCADMIIKHKIPKVFVACIDSFSEVAGRGIEKLRDAGVDVHLGLLSKKEALFLNRRFFTFHKERRPFVILKWAQSADGFIAPPQGRKVMLSNALVAQYVHKMRLQEAAILVGFNTAILDNPILSNRFYGDKHPLRIVLDWENELPADLHLKTDGLPTLIFNLKVDQNIGNCQYIKLDASSDLLDQLMYRLYLLDINSLIVEGGSSTLQSFIDKALWDESHIISTPVVLQNGLEAPSLINGSILGTLTFRDNTIEIFSRNK